LPTSELEKAKNLKAGENNPDVVVVDKKKEEKVIPSVAILDRPRARSIIDRIPVKTPKKEEKETSGTTGGPRFTKFMAHTYRLHEDQIDILNRIEAEIVRNGIPKRERITNNSILRALVDLLMVLNIETSGIDSEELLKNRIFEKCGQKSKGTTN